MVYNMKNNIMGLFGNSDKKQYPQPFDKEETDL